MHHRRELAIMVRIMLWLLMHVLLLLMLPWSLPVLVFLIVLQHLLTMVMI